MKILKKFLFIYNFILIFSLFYQGIRQLKSASDLALILMLASSVVYFFIIISDKIFKFENKFDKLIELLKKVSLLTSFILLAIASFGLIFRFEYIFIIIIFPLPLYFMLTVFYKESVVVESVEPVESVESVESVKSVESVESVNQEPIVDPLKRKFLKIIGGSGLGILMLAIFKPKSAEAAFFGSVPGPGTVAIKDSNDNKIDPAIKSPTDAYGVTQIDDSTPAYYGFVNKEGAWYITKEDTDGSYRYNKGTGNFSGNWSTRASLTYDYFDAIF